MMMTIFVLLAKEFTLMQIFMYKTTLANLAKISLFSGITTPIFDLTVRKKGFSVNQ